MIKNVITVLCIPGLVKKKKVYKLVVRPALMWGSETVTQTKRQLELERQS